MTRYQAEKALKALIPGVWVKQKLYSDGLQVTAYAPGGGKWAVAASRESKAWDLLVAEVKAATENHQLPNQPNPKQEDQP
jgi:hypothetical protein